MSTGCLSHNRVNFLSSYPAPIQNGAASSSSSSPLLIMVMLLPRRICWHGIHLLLEQSSPQRSFLVQILPLQRISHHTRLQWSGQLDSIWRADPPQQISGNNHTAPILTFEAGLFISNKNRPHFRVVKMADHQLTNVWRYWTGCRALLLFSFFSFPYFSWIYLWTRRTSKVQLGHRRKWSTTSVLYSFLMAAPSMLPVMRPSVAALLLLPAYFFLCSCLVWLASSLAPPSCLSEWPGSVRNPL